MTDEITIPKGNSREEITVRRNIIAIRFREWKSNNPLMKCYNKSMKDYISVRFVSITETCTHACLNYLSTLAVMRLDEILCNAEIVATLPAKRNGNQKPFEKMVVMTNYCSGVGRVKMTVGIRRRTHEKVLYCITAIGTGIKKDDLTSSS